MDVIAFVKEQYQWIAGILSIPIVGIFLKFVWDKFFKEQIMFFSGLKKRIESLEGGIEKAPINPKTICPGCGNRMKLEKASTVTKKQMDYVTKEIVESPEHGKFWTWFRCENKECKFKEPVPVFHTTL